MFSSVSVICTAVGVPSDFEAENAACLFNRTEQRLQQSGWNEVLYH